MGADDDVDRAARQPGQNLRALAALLPAGEDRDAHAGPLGQRRDRSKMLAREDFGRRHQRGLSAGLDGARHRKQRHHRLARADIALQQPQHALRLGQVGVDFGQRLFLRARQRIGQGARRLLDALPSPTSGRPAIRARPGAHQRQRDWPARNSS
jgi:hypothetical protein